MVGITRRPLTDEAWLRSDECQMGLVSLSYRFSQRHHVLNILARADCLLGGDLSDFRRRSRELVRISVLRRVKYGLIGRLHPARVFCDKCVLGSGVLHIRLSLPFALFKLPFNRLELVPQLPRGRLVQHWWAVQAAWGRLSRSMRGRRRKINRLASWRFGQNFRPIQIILASDAHQRK